MSKCLVMVVVVEGRMRPIGLEMNLKGRLLRRNRRSRC